jgi:hypothetical protein
LSQGDMLDSFFYIYITLGHLLYLFLQMSFVVLMHMTLDFAKEYFSFQNI